MKKHRGTSNNNTHKLLRREALRGWRRNVSGKEKLAVAMKLSDRIEVNPEVAFGKPVIAGTRMAVGFILDLLAGGWSMADILKEYPHLKEEDVLACVRYAKEMVEEWKVFPLRVKNGGKSVHVAI